MSRGLAAGFMAAATGRPVSAPQPAGVLPLDLIDPGHWSNPRGEIDTTSTGYAELRATIEAQGVLQPVLVGPALVETGRHPLIAGWTRFRIAVELGLESIPVHQSDITDARDALVAAIAENRARNDLRPLAEALALQVLMSDHGLTQVDAGRRIGMSERTVRERLRLLRLPTDAQAAIDDGLIPMDAAVHLERIADGAPAAASELVGWVTDEDSDVTGSDLASYDRLTGELIPELPVRLLVEVGGLGPSVSAVALFGDGPHLAALVDRHGPTVPLGSPVMVEAARREGRLIELRGRVNGREQVDTYVGDMPWLLDRLTDVADEQPPADAQAERDLAAEQQALDMEDAPRTEPDVGAYEDALGDPETDDDGNPPALTSPAPEPATSPVEEPAEPVDEAEAQPEPTRPTIADQAAAAATTDDGRESEIRSWAAHGNRELGELLRDRLATIALDAENVPELLVRLAVARTDIRELAPALRLTRPDGSDLTLEELATERTAARDAGPEHELGWSLQALAAWLLADPRAATTLAPRTLAVTPLIRRETQDLVVSIAAAHGAVTDRATRLREARIRRDAIAAARARGRRNRRLLIELSRQDAGTPASVLTGRLQTRDQDAAARGADPLIWGPEIDAAISDMVQARCVTVSTDDDPVVTLTRDGHGVLRTKPLLPEVLQEPALDDIDPASRPEDDA